MNNVIDSFRGEYFFLSNFYSCKVVYENIRYPSVEHAFQAAKTLDIKSRIALSCAPTASAAKKGGRAVKLRPDWESVKVQVMLDCLREKFKNPTLKQKLIDTRDSELIEGNNHGDRFWGQVNGEGKNILGTLLMQVREELIKNENSNG